MQTWCLKAVRLIRDGREGGRVLWRWGRGRLLYLSLHCHHQNDSCNKMGSDESHFNVSLIVCAARQLKQQLCGALVAAQWRVDTALTLPLFWRRSTFSPVFFGRFPRSSLHSLTLFPPPVPVPNKQPRFCGCQAVIMVKGNGRVVGGHALHSSGQRLTVAFCS